MAWRAGPGMVTVSPCPAPLPFAVPGPAARALRRQAGRAALMVRLGRPLYPTALPASVELRPAADLRRWTRRALWLAAALFALLLAFAWSEGEFTPLEGETAQDYLDHLIGLALSPLLLLPLACLVAAAVLDVVRRRRPDWVKISLSDTEAVVEGPGGAWTIPVREFAAVALRRVPRLTVNWHATEAPSRHAIHRPPRPPLLKGETLWWVELVHPDPDRSVPVWAAQTSPIPSAGRHNAESMARHVAHGFAERLGLKLEA